MTANRHNQGQSTRHSLISRLRDWRDRASWQEFVDTYWKLIFTVALKSGLSHSEAEEVVQETVISIARKMPSFEYDPSRCSFKGWLKHVTRLRIIDQLRRRRPETPLGNVDGGSSGYGFIEQIPDPRGLAIEDLWEQEWQGNLLDAALQRVKAKSKAAQYQAFYMNMVQHIPAREVARMLGMSLGRVYFAGRSLSRMVREECRRLEQASLAPLSRPGRSPVDRHPAEKHK